MRDSNPQDPGQTSLMDYEMCPTDPGRASALPCSHYQSTGEGKGFAFRRQQMAVSSEQLSLVCQGTLEYWLPNLAAYYNPWELVKNIDARALPLEIWRQQVQGGPDNVVFQLLPPARGFSSVRSSLLHQSMDHPRTGPVPLVPRDGEGM